MAVLTFTLSEEGVSAFRDALICLNKFSDEVSLEARKDTVSLSPRHATPTGTNKVVRALDSQLVQVRLRKLQVRNHKVLLAIPVQRRGPVPGAPALHALHPRTSHSPMPRSQLIVRPSSRSFAAARPRTRSGMSRSRRLLSGVTLRSKMARTSRAGSSPASSSAMG